MNRNILSGVLNHPVDQYLRRDVPELHQMMSLHLGQGSNIGLEVVT